MRYIQVILFCTSLACFESSEYECFVSDAKSSAENDDVLHPLFPTTLDEFKVFEYNGVRCAECNDTYDGPCPLHVLKHVKSRPKPHTYLHHRAEKTAPKNILRLEESSIPEAGAGIWTIKKIPKDVVFGPLDGEIVERKDNRTVDIGNYWKIPGTEKSYIDLLDKSRANYMAYINCARNVREENLVKYFNETDQKFYFKSKNSISRYSELLVDYGTEFRRTIGINDLDFSRPKDLKKQIFLCEKCLKASYTPVDLMPNHFCPVPSKKDDLWDPVINNKTIVRKQIVRHERENPNAFKTVFMCKVCTKSNNKSKQMNEKEMKTHFLRKHENITDINAKTVIRDDFLTLNKLCNRFYKCNICANESAGLNWTMAPLRRTESIEFENFVQEFERREKILRGKVKEDDVEKMEDIIMQFDEDTTTTQKLQLTSLAQTNETRKRLKINKNFFFKLRDDAQCHFKHKHMSLCNITDVRVMKYRAEPHECILCGNETKRKHFGLDHHVDFHLNFTEMFDRGLVQLDYRTKALNAPYLENFNFSHLHCTKCNHYIDTDKNHEPEPEELLAHKLSHINLNVLGYNGYVEKKTVQIGKRSPKINFKQLVLHCFCGEFSSDDPKQIMFHIEHRHEMNPYASTFVPDFLEDDPYKLVTNTTPSMAELDLESAIHGR